MTPVVQHICASRRALHGDPRRLHPLRRQQVGHRSAVRSPVSYPASCESGLGGADLQSIGIAAQPDLPVLYAAAAGHPSPARPRSGWLRPSATRGPSPHRIFPVLVLRAPFGVRRADQVGLVVGLARSCFNTPLNTGSSIRSRLMARPKTMHSGWN